MANRVQALKRVRQAERRTVFNRFARTRLRHQIRNMRRALAAKEPDAAMPVVQFVRTNRLEDVQLRALVRQVTTGRGGASP